MSKKDHNSMGRKGRLVRVFSPFFLLVIIMIGLCFTSRWFGHGFPQTTTSDITVTTPLSTREIPTVSNLTPPSSAVLPTPTAPVLTIETSPGKPATSPPLPPNAMIQLSGPPADSSFYLDNKVSAYWTWPLELADDQQFAVYLLSHNNQYLVGFVREPALGDHGYQVSFDPDDLVTMEGTYFLQIQLEQIEPSAILLASTPRAVLFTFYPSP